MFDILVKTLLSTLRGGSDDKSRLAKKTHVSVCIFSSITSCCNLKVDIGVVTMLKKNNRIIQPYTG